MKIPDSASNARIADPVGRAGAVPTRFGKAAANPAPAAAPRPAAAARRAGVLGAVRAEGRAAACPGPDAARSQVFLHGEDGLPR